METVRSFASVISNGKLFNITSCFKSEVTLSFFPHKITHRNEKAKVLLALYIDFISVMIVYNQRYKSPHSLSL